MKKKSLFARTTRTRRKKKCSANYIHKPPQNNNLETCPDWNAWDLQAQGAFLTTKIASFLVSFSAVSAVHKWDLPYLAGLLLSRPLHICQEFNLNNSLILAVFWQYWLLKKLGYNCYFTLYLGFWLTKNILVYCWSQKMCKISKSEFLILLFIRIRC